MAGEEAPGLRSKAAFPRSLGCPLHLASDVGTQDRLRSSAENAAALNKTPRSHMRAAWSRNGRTCWTSKATIKAATTCSNERDSGMLLWTPVDITPRGQRGGWLCLTAWNKNIQNILQRHAALANFGKRQAGSATFWPLRLTAHRPIQMDQHVEGSGTSMGVINTQGYIGRRGAGGRGK